MIFIYNSNRWGIVKKPAYIQIAIVTILVIVAVLTQAHQSLTERSWKSGATTVTFSRGGLLTVSGIGAMGDYCNHCGAPPPWYGVRSSVKKLVIKEGVTHIGDWAFFKFSKLKSVTIPNSVWSIGHYTFGYCANLKSVIIQQNVTFIGNKAFYNCTGLTSIAISSNVASIGELAFAGCTNLISINVESGNTNYSSIDGVLFNKEQTVLINYPASKMGAYAIPNSVMSIGDGAFGNCTGLVSVAIPNSVTTIGEGAFWNSRNLISINVAADNTHYSSEDGVLFDKDKSVLIWYPRGRQGAYTIPDSVTYVKHGAFYNSTGLTSITIPSSITTIGSSKFGGCTNLTSVTIHGYVINIDKYAFQRCTNLRSIIIKNPRPPVNIGSYAFTGTHFRNVCLYVPTSSINAYRAHNWWKNFRCIKDLASAPEEIF